jgi:hypothetical protein
MHLKIGQPRSRNPKTRLEQNRSTIRKDDPMLKKLAVALVAASVFAAPVLAKTVSQTPAAIPGVTATTKITAPVKPVKHVKKSRHTGKQVRNFRHGKVAHFNGKGRTAVKSTGHVVKGPRLAPTHKVSNTSAVR